MIITNKRNFAFCILCCFLIFLFYSGCATEGGQTKTDDGVIDRYSLVTRHNPVINKADKLSPLSVGNGEFAFTADITGLQTFPSFYSRHADNSPPPGSDGFLTHVDFEGATPLATQSQWGWHTFPNPEGYTLEDATSMYDAHGREVPYVSGQNTEAGAWLRENPHRLNLARIGFELKTSDGDIVDLEDLENIRQELDLWTGTLNSRFEIEGNPVTVKTRVHPDHDQLSVRVDASSLAGEQLGVVVAFPYGRGRHAGDPSDWTKPDRHTTREVESAEKFTEWHRVLDEDEYYVRLGWEGSGRVIRRDKHEFLLSFADTNEPVSFSIAFNEGRFSEELPAAEETAESTADYWTAFWSEGGAIDLAESSDPRAHELERRIVLSQYLTAIQSSGSMPPQETGLTYNSWFGKFHLEMHWWHGIHFALWDRLPLLENSLTWYEEIMPKARQTAKWQGYEGVRWPKMVSPDGRDSPSTVGVFLIWQQPHPIYYAELVYRQRPGTETLERFKKLYLKRLSSWLHTLNGLSKGTNMS